MPATMQVKMKLDIEKTKLLVKQFSPKEKKDLFVFLRNELEGDLKKQFRNVFGRKPIDPPISMEEIDAEVKAYRREQASACGR